MGLLGGMIQARHALGFDLAGNIRDAAVRGEFLYRGVNDDPDFIQFTLNADYNFPHNIYGLIEYHFNGRGRLDHDHYELARQIRGEITQLAKNYLACVIGYDVTKLIRLENRAIYNLNDISFFVRPEIQYEVCANLLITAAAQIYIGDNRDEFGRPKNLFLLEAKFSF